MMYLKLDKNQPRSYARQLYEQLSKKILSGELKGEETLPSTRNLSKDLGIARNTVLTVYDMLRSEGFVCSVPGSGYRVNSNIQYKSSPKQIKNRSTASLADETITENVLNFDSGLPALELFPRKKWNRCMTKAMNEAPVSALGYDDPQGRLEFREVLVDYLKRSRGIECKADQIIITSGTKQGISLTAKTLLTEQSEVWIEEPSNKNVRDIFSYHTNKITPIEVDKEGIQPSQFLREGQPDLLFVTPAHQFPLGGTLSIQRRLEVIAFAERTGCYILEDDYDSEFNYQGLPGSSLSELNDERVIYAGTFSKTFFPSLRLGYLVVPLSLVETFRKWKRLADHHSNSICQIALMRYIEEGELERHIRKMKKSYRQRRDWLIELLNEFFGDRVKTYGEQAGMHIVAEFAAVDFTPEVINQLLAAGVYMVPVESHAMCRGRHKNQLLMGYAQLTYEEQRKGIMILKEVIDSLESK